MFIFSLLLKNWKIGLYIAAAIAIAGFAYKFVSSIKKAAQYEIMLETQAKTIENKNKVILGLEQEAKLKEAAIKERDAEVAELEGKLEGITENLGEGSGDLAPAALREFLKRLNEQ